MKWAVCNENSKSICLINDHILNIDKASCKSEPKVSRRPAESASRETHSRKFVKYETNVFCAASDVACVEVDLYLIRLLSMFLLLRQVITFVIRTFN